MNWKEFLKPDWRKIVIFVILFIISSFSEWRIFPDIGIKIRPNNMGFPLPFFGGCLSYGRNCSTSLYEFSMLNFIVDLIFWYLLSCLIVWIYDKVKKKK